MKYAVLIVYALATLALCLNAPALSRLLKSSFRMATTWQHGFRSTGETVDAPRRMTSFVMANGKTIAYCRSCPKKTLPIERSRVLSMSWETLPRPIHCGHMNDVLGSDAVVAAEFEPTLSKKFEKSGYRVINSGGGVNLWCKGEGWNIHAQPIKQNLAIEFLPVGLLIALCAYCFWLSNYIGVMIGFIELSLLTFVIEGVFGAVYPYVSLTLFFLVLIHILLFHKLITPSRTCDIVERKSPILSFVMVSVLAMFYISLTLSHTFVSPNGLGTIGGKAKMILLSEGFPEGFFRNPLYTLYQPAYPPGAASIVLWCYVLSGTCGEWIIQILPCLLMAILTGFVISHAPNRLGDIIGLTVFTTPLSLRLTTLFYPEVYVAACCLIGWERVRNRKNDLLGWIIIGAAGWFKNEGMVYFFALAIGVVIHTPLYELGHLIKGIIIGLILPAIWHIGCRIAGATLDGFLPLSQFCLSHGIEALLFALNKMFCSPWQYAFIYPTSIVMQLCPKWRDTKFLMVLTGTFLSVICFAIVFSVSAEIDFIWHLESMERILWVPSLLLAREIIPKINFTSGINT